MDKAKIIVITPIRNEGWILDNFLKSVLTFADHVILADQNSTDDSLSIISRFANVTLIKNTSAVFNEAERQKLLINKARELFPGRKIIFALDADEIISADSINASSWEVMRVAPANRVFYFEKPDLYLTKDRCIRRDNDYFPLAFVDDDKIEHNPAIIHSPRVPITSDSIKVNIPDIKFLHLAYLRPNVQRAKFRFYSVQENVLKAHPWYRRRKRYKSPKHLLPGQHVTETPQEWFDYKNGIDLSRIDDPNISWHDQQVVELLARYGYWRFWLDDIWDLDFALAASVYFKNIPMKVKRWKLPSFIKLFLKTFDSVFIP